MMNHYLEHLEKTFVEQGGIKERMHAARTGYRQGQDEKMKGLEAANAALTIENKRLVAENASLTAELIRLRAQSDSLKARYDDLRARARAAYNRQQEEIQQLKKRLGEGL